LVGPASKGDKFAYSEMYRDFALISRLMGKRPPKGARVRILYRMNRISVRIGAALARERARCKWGRQTPRYGAYCSCGWKMCHGCRESAMGAGNVDKLFLSVSLMNGRRNVNI
jgi:hypothetical protein